MKEKIVGIIPARMGSSRFYGKPLALINGKPMIQIVYENVKKSKILDKTIVATCDNEIADLITSIGGESIMTSSSHERASDRCAEAIRTLEKNGEKFDIMLMVQGDEPLINTNMIEAAISPLIEDSSVMITNLMAEIKNHKEFEDRNCIKVVVDKNDNAIYFSREPIPTKFKTENVPMRKQVCVIPFRKNFLFEYNKMKPTPLEEIESIDMMRIIENGLKVKMVFTTSKSQSVDTKEDLEKVKNILKI